MANLIALKIVNLDLLTYAKIMFVPSMIGLFIISILLFIYFRKDIPRQIPSYSRACLSLYLRNYRIPHHPPPIDKPHHPPPNSNNELGSINWTMFKVYMAVIILVRACFFVLSGYGISIEIVAVLGALTIIAIRWYSQGIVRLI